MSETAAIVIPLVLLAVVVLIALICYYCYRNAIGPFRHCDQERDVLVGDNYQRKNKGI